MKKYFIACMLAMFTAISVYADPETPTGAYVGDLIEPENTGSCSGTSFANATQADPVQMTATFVPLCSVGQYLKVDDAAPTNGVEGTDYAIIGGKYVYCVACEPGHACNGISVSDLVREDDFLQTSGLGAMCSTGTEAISGVCTPCGLGNFGKIDEDTQLPTCTSCDPDTYADEPGLTACKSCPADWPTNGNATGSQSVTDCYAVCDAVDPVCVTGAQNCAFDSNYVLNGIATYGKYCSSTFTGCVAGYEQKTLGQTVSTTNINTMTHNGTTWTIGLTDAPLTSVQGVYFCEAYDDDEDAITPDVYGCFRKATAVFENTKKIPVNGTPVLVGVASQSTEQACVAACNSGVGSSYTDDTSALALLNSANVDVCDAKTVYVSWGGVEDPGESGMCTYGTLDGLVAPEGVDNNYTKPAYCSGGAGCTFLGWKLVESTVTPIDPGAPVTGPDSGGE